MYEDAASGQGGSSLLSLGVVPTNEGRRPGGEVNMMSSGGEACGPCERRRPAGHWLPGSEAGIAVGSGCASGVIHKSMVTEAMRAYEIVIFLPYVSLNSQQPDRTGGHTTKLSQGGSCRALT